jgi:hypothetical protein
MTKLTGAFALIANCRETNEIKVPHSMRWFYFTQNEGLIKYYFGSEKRSGRDHIKISPVFECSHHQLLPDVKLVK